MSDAELDARVVSSAAEVHDDSGIKRVNQYLFGRLLGTGAYGEVYEAREEGAPADAAPVAVKILSKRRLRRKRVGKFGNALQNAEREVAIWKGLRHPNVVRLIEVVDDKESAHMYMMSELVAGGAVLPEAKLVEPLSEEKARLYFRQLLSAVEYLHSQSVVHRDIKPANLLVAADGETVKLADFGVSQIYKEGNDMLHSTAGTALFAAPEMCTGEDFHGRQVDVWACGVTLHFFLLGRPPFDAPNILAIYDVIQEAALELPDSLPAAAADLLRGLLSKDPAARLTLQQAGAHPWTTLDGTWPMPQPQGLHVSVSRDDIAGAISPLRRLVGVMHARRVSHIAANRVRQRLRQQSMASDRSESASDSPALSDTQRSEDSSSCRASAVGGTTAHTAMIPPAIEVVHRGFAPGSDLSQDKRTDSALAQGDDGVTAVPNGRVETPTGADATPPGPSAQRGDLSNGTASVGDSSSLPASRTEVPVRVSRPLLARCCGALWPRRRRGVEGKDPQ